MSDQNGYQLNDIRNAQVQVPVPEPLPVSQQDIYYPPVPASATQHAFERAAAFEKSNRVKQARDKAQYVRQQKGHSLTLHLLLGWVVLYIPAIYISVSPNHYWHA